MSLRVHRILRSMETQIRSISSKVGSQANIVSHSGSSWSNGNSRPNKSRIQRLGAVSSPLSHQETTGGERTHMRNICGRTSMLCRCLASSGSIFIRATSWMYLLLSTMVFLCGPSSLPSPSTS